MKNGLLKAREGRGGVRGSSGQKATQAERRVCGVSVYFELIPSSAVSRGRFFFLRVHPSSLYLPASISQYSLSPSLPLPLPLPLPLSLSVHLCQSFPSNRETFCLFFELSSVSTVKLFVNPGARRKQGVHDLTACEGN